MTNEERIKQWREKRGAGSPIPDDFDETDIQAAAASGALTRAKAEKTDESVRQRNLTARLLPDPESIEDARLAVLERRSQGIRRTLGRLALFIGLPLFIVLFYAKTIATPLYEGEATFAVQTSEDNNMSASAGLLAVAGGGNAALSDAFKAREFILSRPMMEMMEKKEHFLSHFSTPGMDPLTRLYGPFGLNDDPFAYYQKRVKVKVDVQEGILKLLVQARTRDDAIRFGNAILAAAEQHTNEFSKKISDDQIASLSDQVTTAEGDLRSSRGSLAAVQARRGELSPQATAESVYKLISDLELQRADAIQERSGLLDSGLTNSPLLPRLTTRINSLNQQIGSQRARLAGPGGSALSSTVNAFENASVKKDIAQARWESTMKTLQEAYLRVLAQRRYFVIVVGMAVPGFAAVRDGLGITLPILIALAILYCIFLAIRSTGLVRRRTDSERRGWALPWRRHSL